MKLSHGAEYVLLKVLQSMLWRVSPGAVRSIARGVGRFLFSFAGYRRNVTLQNLRQAFPTITDPDRQQIARASYESVAVTLFEFMLFSRLSSEDLFGMVTVTNPEIVKEAIEERKGVLLLTAHYGSWELFAQAAGITASVDGRLLMKVQSNSLIAGEVDRWRSRFGLSTCPSSSGVREVIRILQDGGWIVIAADQAAPKESISVPFFGREVPTYQGPAAFALQTGAAILLGAAHRGPDGRYTITFQRIRHDDLSPGNEDAMMELTRRHVRATERLIIQDPGQWMWMHKRWKHVDRVTA